MSRLELRFGMPVAHGGRRHGSLSGIILDPIDHRWEALIVRRGLLRRTELLAPRSTVSHVSDSGIDLTVAPSAGTRAREDTVLSAETAIYLECGRALGRLVSVLALPDGRLLHLVVRRGRFAPRVLVPASAIVGTDGSGLRIALSQQEIEALLVHRPDRELALEARQTLANLGPPLRAETAHLRVTVKDGVVELAGHVTSRQRADRIESVVAAVSGVLGVDNQLVGDDEVETEVAVALGRDGRTRGRGITVRVRHGVVTLSGAAVDAVSAEEAIRIAAAAPMARGVVDRIGMRAHGADPGWREAPPVGGMVHAEAGPVGPIARVVIDPRNRRPTGLLVDTRSAGDSVARHGARDRLVFLPIDEIRIIAPADALVSERALGESRRQTAAARTMPAPSSWRPPFPYQPGEVVWPRDAIAELAADGRLRPLRARSGLPSAGGTASHLDAA